MLNVVDDDAGSGNLSDLTKSLQEEAASLASGASNQAPPAAAGNDANDDVDIPEKFRGKSAKEIVEAYKQLESQYGRMSNDLGQQRAITDRILNLRRESDLNQNGAGVTQAQVPKIKATDLAEDPTGSIEKVVKATIASRDAENEQKALEQARQAAAARLVRDHPDYQDFVNNAEFSAWIGASPSRQRVAAAVTAGDFDAGNDLLTEYKEHKKKMSSQTDDNKRLEAARSASLESGNRGNSEGTPKGGRVYSRADLLRLQMTDPEKYYSEDFQAVIMKAYAEKRVK